ncbi:MAG: class I poly(R)-hydroxyalkanoic acid synthase, partial [Rhodobacteraceae bacterium]
MTLSTRVGVVIRFEGSMLRQNRTMAMPEQSPDDAPKLPDVGRMAEQWAKTSERSLALMHSFLGKAPTAPAGAEFDHTAIAAFQDLALRLAQNPMALAEAQVDLWKGMVDVWTNTAARMAGVEPSDTPSRKDRRFAGEEWEETVAFDYIKQSYLVVSDWMQNLVSSADGDMDPAAARKVKFLSRQFVSAISPANFIATNPKVLKETVKTGGENLLAGLNNLLADLERGEGQLKISMTDEAAFEVGRNVASTPGKVVFRNRLFELIMYQPSTEKVHKVPILFVPPWINKFYVLDLKPENSLIKWVVDQGHTLFVISWINPDDSLKDVSFADYMRDGVLV